MRERDFLKRLDALRVPLLVSPPNPPGSSDEFKHPTGWSGFTSDGNAYRLAGYREGYGQLALMGEAVGFDVDPQNGGDIEKSRGLLSGLGVKVFAEVATPGGGRHFYTAGHPEMATCHKLKGWPGVDIQSWGALLFLPGTCRPKYQGAGYTILLDNLEALADGGDPDGAEALADWVAQHWSGVPATFEPAEPWTGAAPDKRQAAYLAKALSNIGDRVAAALTGQRNVTLFNQAMTCGNLIAGAGMDEAQAINVLLEASSRNGLVKDDGERAALATIRSGLKNGKAKPRAVPGKDPLTTLGSGEVVDLTTGEILPAEPNPDNDTTQPDHQHGEDEQEEVRPSWAPVDLMPYLTGTYRSPLPSLLTRTDGVNLFYPGLTHSAHGETESAKSLVLQFECTQQIMAGNDVLFLDFESDAGAVTERLLMLGATLGAIHAHFVYLRPEVDPTGSPVESAAWAKTLSRSYSLAVIDGVTDSLGVFGYSTKDNDDITAWMRIMPKRIARKTGAAVVVVDHVTKDGDSRGRFAIGGQAKLAGLTGAAYTVEVVSALGRGLRGVTVMRVAKDRPGYIRGHSGPMRQSDRTQETARIVVDSTGPVTVVTVEPWRGSDGVTAAPQAFRPTALMEHISVALEGFGPLTFNGINERVKGKQGYITTATDVLEAEGYITRTPGVNRSIQHTRVKPYRQTSDPLSDKYLGPGHTQVSKTGVSVSRPYTGERDTHTQVSPETPGTHLGHTQDSEPSGDGRCTDCHFHIDQQGHRSDCPQRSTVTALHRESA